MCYHKERKATPVYSGVLKYFPDALAEIARVSKTGNDQHNPDQPLHWSKEKSSDHEDCIVRHLLDHAKGDVMDKDGHLHLAKAAWRALAALQIYLETQGAAACSVPDGPEDQEDSRKIGDDDPRLVVGVFRDEDNELIATEWHGDPAIPWLHVYRLSSPDAPKIPILPLDPRFPVYFGKSLRTLIPAGKNEDGVQLFAIENDKGERMLIRPRTLAHLSTMYHQHLAQ